jgi:hypothetical protein
VFAAKDVRQEVVVTEALLLLLLLAAAAGIRRYRALLQVFPCLCSVFFCMHMHANASRHRQRAALG